MGVKENLLEKISLISTGEQEVFEAGKQAEYDVFWDTIQENGIKKNYAFNFAGNGWNSKTFKPKYDIVPTNCRGLFYYGSCSGMDLTEHLNALGVVLDTSQSTTFQQMFIYGSPKRVPILDTRSSSSINQLASASLIETFDKIILRDDGSQTFSQPFGAGTTASTKIINLTLEGVIGQNGFNISGCANLSKQSILNIVSVLSPTTSNLTVTLSLTAVKKAFETSEGASDGDTSAEWLSLIATKSNWGISLL